MLAPPKSLVNVGTRFLTAGARRRLRPGRGPLAAQEKTYAELVGSMARCSFGRSQGLSAGQTYAEFQQKVPLRTYEDFMAQIERMKRGEADVLWPGRCAYYAISSGTTAGRTKYLPITDAMFAHFRKAGLDSLLYYTARVGHTKVFNGKHLFLGGSTTLTPIEESKPFTAYAGDLSGITAIKLPAWIEKHIYEPGGKIAQMSDWPAKIQAIVDRTIHRKISLLAGIPSWLLILAEAVRKRAGINGQLAPNLKSVWPQLECLIHGGVPLGPFTEELRATLGPGVNFHEVYPASEGFIATQDADASLGLRLMTDVGLFFEFLPMEDFDDRRFAHLGPKTIPLEAVKTEVDYALVMTTPGGLCRYVIGDVVRFLSTDSPRLIYVGRTKLQLSGFGEHVIEKEVTDALMIVCRRHHWTITNFHVAPLFANSLIGQNRGRHEWWVELKPPSVETPTGPLLAAELDAELIRLNDDYEAKRKGGGLEPPFVRLVMPGVFEKWMREHGKWGGQSKMPRCRSDRQVADELAKIARFAEDI